MRKYFGTDGIRRIANTELSPNLVYRVAKAGAYVLSKHTDHMPTILIGRDTRISGTLIESAMVAGFLSYGANVKLRSRVLYRIRPREGTVRKGICERYQRGMPKKGRDAVT